MAHASAASWRARSTPKRWHRQDASAAVPAQFSPRYRTMTPWRPPTVASACCRGRPANTPILADALAAHASTKWCLTFTGPDGRPIAHGSARNGARAGPPRRPRTRTGSRDGPGGMSRDGPGTWARPTTWIFTLTPLSGGDCDHAWETPAYRPSAALRHRVEIRHVTCVFPGCRRPAAQCDADHTIAYQSGGKTCLCNLAPLCRHHHEVKQASDGASDKPRPAP